MTDPRSFAYHAYLHSILGVQTDAPLFIATEREFSESGGIPYPYRSYFYVVGLMHEDRCRLRVDFRDFDIPKRALTLVGPGIVRLWLENNWKVKNTTVFFTPELLEGLFNATLLLEYPFFKPGAQHVLELSDDHYKHVNELIQLLQKHSHQHNVSAPLLVALLEYVQELYPSYIKDSSGLENSHTLQTFTQLLHANFQEHKDVEFYANELHLSAKHLSALLKEATGKTAKQLIDEYVLFEAKSLLKQSALSTKEITYWLGYDDPSYFSKLFKQKVGVSPQHYRA